MGYPEGVDYVAPTDAQLAAMPEKELLGFGNEPDELFAGLPIEHPAARYPVLVGTDTREEAEAMGADFEPEHMRDCWIDLKTRRLNHVPGCTCIKAAEAAVDCARLA